MGGCELFETLEDRRLCSVSAASTFSAMLKTGAVFKYNVYTGSKLEGTFTQTVKGSTTFNKIKCIEIDTSTGSGKTAKVISKTYVALDSKKNYLNYGSVSIVGTSTTTDTFKPVQISYPGTLTAGKVYSSTVTDTAVTKSPPAATQTSVSTEKETIKLVSEKLVSVKVPAGTFNAYQIISTSTFTEAGQTSTSTTTLWFVPGKGLVKTSTGSGATASTLQLTK